MPKKSGANAAKAAKPAKAAPIVDVAHPGKTAPPANSKSVIIRSGPILKDPMVVDEITESEDVSDKGADTDKPALRSPTAPLLPSEKPAEATEITDLVPAVKPDKPSPADSSDKAAKPDPPAESTATKAKPAKTAESDTTDDESAPAKDTKDAKAIEAAAAEEAKHQDAIDKLAESKQYYLSINTVEKRRSRRFVALGIILSLLLILAWADIALDAGIIHVNGVKPVTHFFSN